MRVFSTSLSPYYGVFWNDGVVRLGVEALQICTVCVFSFFSFYCDTVTVYWPPSSSALLISGKMAHHKLQSMRYEDAVRIVCAGNILGVLSSSLDGTDNLFQW